MTPLKMKKWYHNDSKTSFNFIEGDYDYHFSNSLIIHQEKTKKITTLTVVWICVPYYHKILPTLALNFSKNE